MPSTIPPPQLLLRSGAPQGECPSGPLTFTWEWAGTPRPWRLEVLDEHLEPVVERHADTTSLTLDEEDRALLVPGSIYYWRVQAVDDEGLRTSPVLFLTAD